MFNALEMYTVEGQDGEVRSVTSLAKMSIIGGVLDEEVDAEQVHMAAMIAIIHPIVFQAVTNALLETEELMDFIATFGSFRVEKNGPRET